MPEVNSGARYKRRIPSRTYSGTGWGPSPEARRNHDGVEQGTAPSLTPCLAWISTDRNSPKIRAHCCQCLTSSIGALRTLSRELQHPAMLPPESGSESRDPSQRWGSRVAPRSVPTCHATYPGERPHGHRSVAHTWLAVQRPSPFSQRVDPHDITFEACSGFTRVAARRLADPPKVGHSPESFGKSVALPASSVAIGVHR